MNFTQFVDAFLTALYHRTMVKEVEWMKLQEIVDTYGLPWRDSWGARLLQDLESRDLAMVHRHMGNFLEQDIALSSGGFRYVEDRYGENVSQVLESYGLNYEVEQGNTDSPQGNVDIQEEVGIIVGDRSEPVINSEAWTGITTYLISSNTRAAFLNALQQATDILEEENLTNEQKAQALCYLAAARTLAEAPEPPSDVIWDLIERAGALCGILGLFLSIFMARLS